MLLIEGGFLVAFFVSIECLLLAGKRPLEYSELMTYSKVANRPIADSHRIGYEWLLLAISGHRTVINI